MKNIFKRNLPIPKGISSKAVIEVLDRGTKWNHKSNSRTPEIPVYLNGNHDLQMGTAVVKQEGRRLIADFRIIKDEPKKVLSLYPAISGIVRERNKKGRITSFTLTGVHLSINPNVDPHIPPVDIEL